MSLQRVPISRRSSCILMIVVSRRSMLSWRLNRRNIFPDKDIIKRYIQKRFSDWLFVRSAEVEYFLHILQSLNDETKDSACFTRKFYVKSAKAPARIGKGKLWLLDQLFKKHVYGVRAGGEKMYNVFHNQFLVALKRLQVDKQELVHKSANETVMVSTYTRIKAIPIGHIRLINGDNLDTQTPMTSKTLGGVFVYLKIPTLFASVIFSSKALRTANLRWVETLLWLSQIRLLQCMSSEKTFPHHKILELVMRKVLVPVDLSYLEVKKQRARDDRKIERGRFVEASRREADYHRRRSDIHQRTQVNHRRSPPRVANHNDQMRGSSAASLGTRITARNPQNTTASPRLSASQRISHGQPSAHSRLGERVWVEKGSQAQYSHTPPPNPPREAMYANQEVDSTQNRRQIAHRLQLSDERGVLPPVGDLDSSSQERRSVLHRIETTGTRALTPVPSGHAMAAQERMHPNSRRMVIPLISPQPLLGPRLGKVKGWF
ncbi:hypothetical protein YC2023_050478 [Brassica napus]